MLLCCLRGSGLLSYLHSQQQEAVAWLSPTPSLALLADSIRFCLCCSAAEPVCFFGLAGCEVGNAESGAALQIIAFGGAAFAASPQTESGRKWKDCVQCLPERVW